MGIFSASLPVVRYSVEGEIEENLHETVYKGLKEYSMPSIEDDESETVVGWTSFEHPFKPQFSDYSFVIGEYMVFSLRIDKKSIPGKLIHKNYTMALAERTAESGQQFLSKAEKAALKDEVIFSLSRRIPATPSVYDLMWNFNQKFLLFFSTHKGANEELESLFIKSFRLRLVRVFPFTAADVHPAISDSQRDMLYKLQPTKFT